MSTRLNYSVGDCHSWSRFETDFADNFFPGGTTIPHPFTVAHVIQRYSGGGRHGENGFHELLELVGGSNGIVLRHQAPIFVPFVLLDHSPVGATHPLGVFEGLVSEHEREQQRTQRKHVGGC